MMEPDGPARRHRVQLRRRPARPQHRSEIARCRSRGRLRAGGRCSVRVGGSGASWHRPARPSGDSTSTSGSTHSARTQPPFSSTTSPDSRSPGGVRPRRHPARAGHDGQVHARREPRGRRSASTCSPRSDSPCSWSDLASTWIEVSSSANLVIAVDGSGLDAVALPVIASWMRTFGGGTPTFVEVIPFVPAIAEHAGPCARSRPRPRVRRPAGDVRHRGRGRRASTARMPHRPSRTTSGTWRTAVVVVTAERWSGAGTHWRSTSRKLAFGSIRPVLVVPLISVPGGPPRYTAMPRVPASSGRSTAAPVSRSLARSASARSAASSG